MVDSQVITQFDFYAYFMFTLIVLCDISKHHSVFKLTKLNELFAAFHCTVPILYLLPCSKTVHNDHLPTLNDLLYSGV